MTESPTTPETGAEAGAEVEPAGETDKRVSWAELFFDLVFVVAVTRVTARLEHDHGALGLAQALVVFVPIYWTWVGASILTNQQDVARPAVRIRLFAVALGAVFMSLALPDAFGSTGLLFALSYWGARLVLFSSTVAALRHDLGPLLTPYAVSSYLTGPLLILGALLDDHVRLGVWALAAVIDLSTPSLLAHRLRHLHVDAAHLAERFGLFVLIAIGESVAAVMNGVDVGSLGVGEGAAVVAAFVAACGLWWVYFNFAADAVRHALATAEVQLDITRLVLTYGHLGFIASIIVVALGLHDAIAEPTRVLGWADAAILYGATAAYLATFGFTRWTMFHLMSWTRVGAAVAVIALLPLAALVPAVVALALLAAGLTLLNIVEWQRVGRTGWFARRGAGPLHG